MVHDRAMWPLWSMYMVLTVLVRYKADEYLAVALKMKWVVNVPEDVAGISCTYLPNRLPIRCLWILVIKRHSYYQRCRTQNHCRSVGALLMLCWHSLSGCGRARVSSSFDHWGGQYIQNGLWRTDVNILWSTLTYVNMTINVKLETQNRRLEPTGLAKPSKPRVLTGKGPGLVC